MAERRMLSRRLMRSDSFMELPLSTQALYLHMNLEADDDGFINNPKMIQRMVGASPDDLKLLLVKGFLLGFDSGVVVIRDWRLHNYIQKDRYKETQCLDEKAVLRIKKNKEYSLTEGECIQNVSKMDTQSRVSQELGKSKDRLELEKISLSQSIEDVLTNEEKNRLMEEIPRLSLLFHYIDARITEMPKHPYNYIKKVAQECHWMEDNR